MKHLTEEQVQDFYGEKELRWYQVAAINELQQHLLDGFMRICINLPTGAGKTLTLAASMSHPGIRTALNVPSNRKMRILFVAHLDRLLTQAEQTFIDDSGVDLVLQSMFSDIPDEVIEKGWDVCVLDECHHEGCMTFQYMLERVGDFPIIGLTATTDRADGCLIKFQKIVAPISREQAVKEGFLAKTNINSFIDTSPVNKIKIVSDIIDEFGSEFGQTMIFLRTHKEVSAIHKHLQNSGYSSVAILDQTDSDLGNLLDSFSKGEFQFLVNCNKINEGVDVKGCTDVLLGKTFGSYPQLNQVIGRASRPDSECNVWELINPISGKNLDTTIIVGTPETHRLLHKNKNVWFEDKFDYVSHQSKFESALRFN